MKITTNDDWYLAETHLQAGESLEESPLVGRWGNPVPGRFEYEALHEPVASEYEYTVPMGDREPGDVVLVALQASVEQWVDGELIQQEGAWAAGDRFTQRGNWGMYFSYTVKEWGLVLWNTLSSAEAIENSETGLSGKIVGTVNFEHIVKFGPGITPNIGYAGSGVDFPTTVADPDQGTVEMWVQFYTRPAPYSHGVYGFVNVNHWRINGVPDNVMVFAWHNSNSNLNFGLRFNGTGRSVNVFGFDPPMNTPVHLAAVWDRNGIDGSGDYMRIYVNGALVGSNSTYNDWGTDNTQGGFRVAAPWDGSYAIDRYSVESIKVWDHAKTEF